MDIILYFFIFSFLGWVLESVWASITYKKLTSKQTLLKSPLCPVYGIGGVALYLTLSPVKESWLLLFSGGFFVASSVEYLTALYYEHFFGVKWWDYEKNAGNLNGKVCVRLSLIWGVITIAFFEIFLPPIQNFLLGMASYQKLFLTAFFSFYFINDYKNTLREIKKYSDKLPSLADGKFVLLRRIND